MPSSLHQQACARKQRERQAQIDALPAVYSSPLSDEEEAIHALSLARLVQECRAGTIAPADVLSAYGKKTLAAHRLTNCITDFMFDEALRTPALVAFDGESDSADSSASMPECPLHCVPVSLKDTIDIADHDTTVGLSRNANSPVPASSPIVCMLQDAGAILHVKTTVPASLIGIETESDLFGRTTNPYNQNHTVGASTGGGAALLACGGSKIEIATDIGGSARIPAHFCGIWGLKGSVGRFPTWGTVSSMPGLEGVPIVAAPMAGSLADLEEFWKRIVGMKPWIYDFTCIPLPWQKIDLQVQGRKLKWGVIWDDGVCAPTPACKRSLSIVVDALAAQGHEVVEFMPPKISDLLTIGYQLVFADGGAQMRDTRLTGETLNPPLRGTIDLLALPRLFKRFMAWMNRAADPFYANLLEVLYPKSILEERSLIVQRDEFRSKWHDAWTEAHLDFVLTVPHPLPALENGTGARASLMSACPTFLFSILDYTAGVLPVCFTDRARDALPADFLTSEKFNKMNVVAKGVYSVYDSEKMHGLPLGVQVVGKRLQEEKVLEGMKVIERALKEAGTPFVPKVLV
ncbi:amidase signature domain-containing protein [Mycena albidolilacea]|uniref:Amidase signature domain-containing protein n=1 Tax=Mycena albidolilacea TaxID=1033008 RepID=A0AAD7AL39_9AGAR|nr:amidase signature domain-containing protein [Mycena albidolilacea]